MVGGQAAQIQQQAQQQAQQQNQQQQAQQVQQQAQQQQLSYSVIPQMQTVNIDGQEALFIPSSAMSAASQHQSQPTMHFTTAGGQLTNQQVQLANQQVQLANGQTIIAPQPVSLIRAPNVFPTSIIQNIGGQTVQLPTGWFLYSSLTFSSYYKVTVIKTIFKLKLKLKKWKCCCLSVVLFIFVIFISQKFQIIMLNINFDYRTKFASQAFTIPDAARTTNSPSSGPCHCQQRTDGLPNSSLSRSSIVECFQHANHCSDDTTNYSSKQSLHQLEPKPNQKKLNSKIENSPF